MSQSQVDGKIELVVHGDASSRSYAAPRPVRHQIEVICIASSQGKGTAVSVRTTICLRAEEK
jgi:hypothetical protein